MKKFNVTPEIQFGDGSPLLLVLGPCVIESAEHCMKMAEKICAFAGNKDYSVIFKASFDKANRSSVSSYRGPGMKEGLKILKEVRAKFSLPVLTDFHEPSQAAQVAEVADILQIPAFLCRQTDMIAAAAETGKPVNIKKGQFLSPWEVSNVVEKARSFGNSMVSITERGFSFGYNNLVVDFRSFKIIRDMGVPVIFDGTHSIQLPGGLGIRSGGQREFIPTLTMAAAAAGIDGLFLEVHDDPENALCDGANSLPLGELGALLEKIIAVRCAVSGGNK